MNSNGLGGYTNPQFGYTLIQPILVPKKVLDTQFKGKERENHGPLSTSIK